MSDIGPKIAVDVPVVILAGGLGTRLREETAFRPKPMAVSYTHLTLPTILRV